MPMSSFLAALTAFTSIYSVLLQCLSTVLSQRTLRCWDIGKDNVNDEVERFTACRACAARELRYANANIWCEAGRKGRMAKRCGQRSKVSRPNAVSLNGFTKRHVTTQISAFFPNVFLIGLLSLPETIPSSLLLRATMFLYGNLLYPFYASK